ncbi:hypothetical protein [uncultured Sulfitobacter sp.]|uniref:hypothetical protein n=1 Tax=uncultured Sulfitobacter sp. TaxID=191468 RepID=UPI00261D6011|nr:hypothetical protein [uncultured Sulfitobacter sp.]
MSVLLLTNPYASQAQPPTLGSLSTGFEAPGTLTPQAVTPTESSADTRNSGSSTSYDGSGAGAGGAAAQQPLKQDAATARPIDATPRSIVTAQAESAAQTAEPVRAEPPADPPEIVDMAEKTRQRAQEMPLPLPTLPFLMRA